MLYINWYLQNKIKERKIVLEGNFVVSNFLKACDLTPSNRIQFKKYVDLVAPELEITYLQQRLEERRRIDEKIFEYIRVSKGVCYFRITPRYFNSVITKITTSFIITTDLELKNYKRALSFKLDRYFKSRVSSGIKNMPLEIELNTIRTLLWGPSKLDWKYVYASNPKQLPTILMSSFINNIVKVAIKEVSDNSSLTIKGPVNQEYDNNDPYNKTLKFIVSNDVKSTISNNELKVIGGIRHNLKQFLQQTGLTEIESEGMLEITKKKIEEIDMINVPPENEEEEGVPTELLMKDISKF